MVIQNYDVQTSSQRTFMSLKSSSMLATKNLDAPVYGKISTGSNAQPSATDTVVLASSKEKKPNNGLSLGHLKQAHKQMQDDSLSYLSAKSRTGVSRAGRTGKAGHGRMPKDPKELQKYLFERMFEMILGTSKYSSSGSVTTENGSFSFGNSSSMSLQSESFEFGMSISGAYFSGLEAEGAVGAPRAGWNVERFEYESEQVSYQVQGVINTADGRTLNVDINMSVSRQFVSYMNLDVEVTRNNLCDPLVINYGGTAASLTGEKFAFDLTSDGNMENLASLADGSGFLAIDKNGDGRINNGSELFGPNSGCGFSELREYDGDKNGWIDEADDVFNQLVVWSRDKDGNETSYTLKELGIGAIYLGDIATEFSFKDESNELLGVMRSTSFFLKEDGGAGTLSHIDLAV